MFKAFVHPEIQLFLDSQRKIKNTRFRDQNELNEQFFVFPWGNASTTANVDFWLGLLGRDEGNSGWLGDTVSSFYMLIVHVLDAGGILANLSFVPFFK